MNREEALDVALGQIERQFGKGSVMKMSDQAQVQIGAISTGSLVLDVALGIGGLPRGRVVEVFGPESSGKTTLVYHVIAEAQRRGGICAFIDAEHAMDPQYARKIGVNVDDLLVSQPDTGEQALEITELLVRSGALDVVAVDSVAALTPKAEIEGEMGDSHVGLQARLMSQALRKLAGTLNRTDTICLFTNQLREKIGVMFGSPETTPGGRALKFYSSVRLDIRRIETLKDGAEAYGNRVRVKVVKNKVAPPFKQAEFDIIYGSGISWESTVLDVGIERKIVAKSGSYFSFGDERLGQGRQNAASFLKEHPDVVQQILQQIQAAGGSRAGDLGAAAADRRRRRGDHSRRRRGGGARAGGSRLGCVTQGRERRRAGATGRCRAGASRSALPRPDDRGAFGAACKARGGGCRAGAGARDTRADRLRGRRALCPHTGGAARRPRLRRRVDPLRPRGAWRRRGAGRGGARWRSSRNASARPGSWSSAAGASRRRGTWPRADSAPMRSSGSLRGRTEKR